MNQRRARDADAKAKCGFRGADGGDGVFRPRRMKEAAEERAE